MYRCYHSDLKIQYAAQTLSQTLLKPIARSTKQRWKNKTINSFWTPYPIETNADPGIVILRLTAENQHLRKKVKALFCLVQIYRKLFRAFEVKRQHILPIKLNVQHLTQFCERNNLHKTVWRYLPFSLKQWQVWNVNPACPASLQGLCRKTYPQQLSIQEQNTIKATCNSQLYLHWPLCSIYFQLMRQKLLHCSISTFYRHCRLLNITRKRNKYPKHYNPIRADKPFKILHQDITIFRTANGVKHYIYVIRDNFSRAILACNAATQYSSEIAKQTLQNVLVCHNLLNEEGTLITDDGAENKGLMDRWLQKPGNLWKKVVAQLDIVQSNSMVEAGNKLIKYRFLYKQAVADSGALDKLLAIAQQNFNAMPNAQLAGCTPDEVMKGAIPDRWKFKDQIRKARKSRMVVNRSVACDMICRT